MPSHGLTSNPPVTSLQIDNHVPQRYFIGLALQKQAADELGSNMLGGAAEEGLEEVLGGRGGESRFRVSYTYQKSSDVTE